MLSKPTLLLNDLSIQKKSIAFIEDTKVPGKYSITFTFDALCECLITFYFLVKEVKDSLTELTVKYTFLIMFSVSLMICLLICSFAALAQNVPPPKTYKYSAVKGKKFPENVMTIELSKYPRDILFERQDDDEYALVIRMERVMPDKEERRIFYNYFEFAGPTGTAINTMKNVGLKLLRQKMEYNNQAFEIQEIYGINASIADNQANIEDTEKDCVICMGEKIDTIILPCR